MADRILVFALMCTLLACPLAILHHRLTVTTFPYSFFLSHTIISFTFKDISICENKDSFTPYYWRWRWIFDRPFWIFINNFNNWKFIWLTLFFIYLLWFIKSRTRLRSILYWHFYFFIFLFAVNICFYIVFSFIL